MADGTRDTIDLDLALGNNEDEKKGLDWLRQWQQKQQSINPAKRLIRHCWLPSVIEKQKLVFKNSLGTVRLGNKGKVFRLMAKNTCGR